MTAEQHLLDVIAKTRIGSVTIAPEMAARILAALREAIAEEPKLSLALIPEAPPLTDEQKAEHAEAVVSFDRIVKLGRAVEQLDLDPGTRYWTYDEFFDAIYTAADVERQP